MPYRITKVSGKKCYKVSNRNTGKVHAYCTTKKKAESQVRLLRMKGD